MNKLSTILAAASLAAATSFAADPPKANIKPDSPVAADNVLGPSTRSNLTTEATPPPGKTLSRSEKRAAKQAKDKKDKAKKKGVVQRHLDLGGDKTTNPSPTMTDTKNSVTGNPGAQ